MTVDELGRSLVILLPSQPQFGPSVVGQITVSNGLGTVVLTKAYQATFVASSSVVPSSPVLLNFDDESKVNNMLLIDTPKNVTQAAKEAKKAAINTEKEDTGEDKNKKMEKKETKSESKSAATSVSQVEEISTESATEATNLPVAVVQENIVTKLDITAISPSTNIAVMDAIAEKQSVQPTSISIVPIAPIISIPTSTVNNGFTTNGTHAILYITNGNNMVWYTLKADANAIFNITQNTESKEYPLNFGSKLKVNIIQK
jgi:hypothetical protein